MRRGNRAGPFAGYKMGTGGFRPHLILHFYEKTDVPLSYGGARPVLT